MLINVCKGNNIDVLGQYLCFGSDDVEVLR